MVVQTGSKILILPVFSGTVPVTSASSRPVGHMLPQQPSRPSAMATAKPQPKASSKYSIHGIYMYSGWPILLW